MGVGVGWLCSPRAAGVSGSWASGGGFGGRVPTSPVPCPPARFKFTWMQDVRLSGCTHGHLTPSLPRVCDWIKAFAEERSLRWRQDAAGNVVVYRPGSAGGETAAPVILQGHLDMVTEKDAAVQHDFSTDPIRLLREGGWITADGTTLGADNGGEKERG